MIAIITRCRNRLEFTIRTVQSVAKTEGEQYKHIIIDNASSDGTREWFKWMYENTQVLKHCEYYRYEKNQGDWGGMFVAQPFTKDCDYVVQLDNDILVTPDWLTAMRAGLENTDYKTMSLRRENVLWKLKPLTKPVKIQGYEIARVERPVACFMMSKQFYDLCCEKIPPKKGMRSKYIIAQLAKRQIGKVLNVTCQEIDSQTQRTVYSPKNSQIWEKI